MRPRFKAIAAAVAVIGSSAVPAPPAGAIEAHTYGQPFCRGAVLHDYGAILDRMPPVRHPPASEELPFGPRNLNFYPSAFSPVIVGRGGYGYGFFDETYRDRTLHLDWDVATRLFAVGGHGKTLRRLSSKEGFLGVVRDIGERSFWLDTPAHPGLFRFEIEFRDAATGQVLGDYSEYLRVVKPTFHARIAVDDRSLRPGSAVYARVENRGSESVSFGEEFGVQRFERGRWRPAPGVPRVWSLVGLNMFGGYAGWCMRYRVAEDASPGWYRFVKGLAPAGGRHGRAYVAAFRVGR